MASQPDFIRLQRNLAGYFRTDIKKGVPASLNNERLKVYKDLIHGNISSFIDTQFPICGRLVGKNKWKRLIKHFIAHHKLATPFFHQITLHFLLFLKQHLKHEESARKKTYPACLLELAHFEWQELAVVMAEDTPIPPFQKKITATKPLVLVPVIQLVQYHYPVHYMTLPEDGKPVRIPRRSAQPIYLIVYRKLDDDLGVMTINSGGIQLMNQLISAPKCSVKTHFQRLIKLMAIPKESRPAFEKSARQQLTLLQEEGVILGSPKTKKESKKVRRS